MPAVAMGIVAACPMTDVARRVLVVETSLPSSAVVFVMASRHRVHPAATSGVVAGGTAVCLLPAVLFWVWAVETAFPG